MLLSELQDPVMEFLPLPGDVAQLEFFAEDLDTLRLAVCSPNTSRSWWCSKVSLYPAALSLHLFPTMHLIHQSREVFQPTLGIPRSPIPDALVLHWDAKARQENV